MRGVWTPLTKLAEELHVAVIGIAHFNKKEDVKAALLRVSDSIAYVAAPRHVYTVLDGPRRGAPPEGPFCRGNRGRGRGNSVYFDVHTIALKSGESAELAQVYYIGSTCKSLLKATPEVEILDGPAGVTAAIKEEMVVPRGLGCTKPVPGGKLIITANEIEEYGRARLVLRVKMKTSLGDRQWSRDVNISLIPSEKELIPSQKELSH